MLKRTSVTALLLGLMTSAAGAWEIPLTAPVDGKAEGWRPISIGVPLLPGQAKETTALGLAMKGADGKLTPLPAQYRVLARWWRGDNSIRWVLVDTAVQVQPNQAIDIVLTDRNLPPSGLAKAARVEQADDKLTIDTGAATFVINRKKFNLLDSVKIGGAELLASSAQTGGVMEDTYGNTYYASAGTRSVEVIDAGPLRVQVRARGSFIDPAGKGYSKGLYRYDVTLNFHAGSAAVYVDYVLVNNAGKSIGSPTFEDASVILKLAGAKTATFLPDAKGQSHTLAAGESICLYQDSTGADDWNATPGVGNMHSNGYSYPKGAITSFPGYRLYKRTSDAQRAATRPDDGGEMIGEGTRARGLVAAESDPNHPRMFIFLPKFWQLFPKSLEVGGNGTVRIGILPRESKVYHYLEDTAGCGTEFVLDFLPALTTIPSRAWAERVTVTWDGRLMPRPLIEHMAACGALADMGPYSVPTRGLDKKPDTRVSLYSDRSFTTDRLYGNAFGWSSFGERWRSNGGHGRRGARQPIDEDNYLYRWYLGGRQDWYEAGDARSRHFRDIRVYQIDLTEQDPFSFKDWNDFRAANRNEDWTNRPQPKDAEIQKFSVGRYGRSDWPFPNPEHTTIDLLYDRYLLFGDVRCYENMRIGAAHGGYFSGRGSPMGDGWPWRANGWGMRALFRYWELTGDKLADGCLRDVIKTHSAHIGKSPMFCHDANAKDGVHWWFTNVYSHAAAMIALHTGDAKMVELLKTLCAGKEKNAANVPSLFAVLWALTGDEAYKKSLLGDGDGANLLNVGGYFPAADHWLVHQPTRAKK